jgi:hypothetical protein
MSQAPSPPDPPLVPDDDPMLTQAVRPPSPPKPQQQPTSPPPPLAQPQPYPQQPYAQQPYAQQPYPQQPGAPQPYQPQPYPGQIQTLEYLTPGAPAGGVWSYGNILVMHRQAQLPPTCIKCGAPGDGVPMKRKLTWHPWWVYLLILANLIIYIIVAAIVSSRATVYVGVCARHRAKRRTHLAIAWLLFLGALVAFFVAGNLGRGNDDLVAALVISGIVMILAALIWAVVISSMICTPYKIDPQYVWLKGAGAEYLAQFPPMPGGPQVY